MTAPRIVVSGGHSAGHIEPSMNFADALRRLEATAEITALGTVRGLGTTLIPPATTRSNSSRLCRCRAN